MNYRQEKGTEMNHRAKTAHLKTASSRLVRLPLMPSRVGALSRLRFRVALALAALAGLLAFAAPASATPVHKYLFGFNGSDTPNFFQGSFGIFNWGIAVDNSSGASAGKVYAGDNSHDVIDKFSPSASSASYLCQITGTGSASTSASECDKSTSGPGAFTSVLGLAVDPTTGFLYSFDASDHKVYEFEQSGKYTGHELNLGSVSARQLTAFGGAAYVVDETNNRITKWEPATNTVTTFSTGSDTPTGSFGEPKGVAVDGDPTSPSYKDVYVADTGSSVIDKFDETGKYLCQITGKGESSTSSSECSKAEPGLSSTFGFLNAIAVDPNSGHLYISNASQTIDEFSPTGNLLAAFNGGESPRGFFAAFNIAISKATGYVYVMGDANGAIEVFGPDRPVVTTNEVTAATASSATFHGKVNPMGLPVTNCQFEYIESTQFDPFAANPYSGGQTVPCEGTLGSGETTVPVEAHVTGLQAGKVYHYRLVAENANGPSVGGDQFFGAPTVTNLAATSITQGGAQLNARISPDNLATTYQFEYGPTTSYGSTIPASPAAAGAGGGETAVSQVLSGLAIGTTYHYRVVATNASGTAHSADRTFTTLPAAILDIQPPQALTAKSARLGAYVDPLGSHTTFEFEYGTTTAYGTTTPMADVGEGNSPELALTPVTGLQPNTTYHYRVVATNGHGTAISADESFTTEPAICPNEEFRTGPSANLPQCRAFEQVSPEEKGAAPATAPDLGSTDGRIFYLGLGSFAGSNYPGGSVQGNDYLANRTSAGWVTESMHPNESETGGQSGGLLLAQNESLTQALYQEELVGPGGYFEQVQAGTLAMREPGGTILSAAPRLESHDSSEPGWDTEQHQFAYQAESADFSHVILASNFRVLPSDTLPEHRYLRLYDITTGPSPSIAQVNVNSNGTLMEGCGSEVLEAGGRAENGKVNEISGSGARIFFADEVKGECFGQQVYVRENDTSTKSISNPETNAECTSNACVTSPRAGAVFSGASEDGSKALLLTSRQLTNDAAQGGGTNLYLYDFNAAPGHNLSAVSGGDASGQGPNVQDVVRIAPDGARIYFVAQGQLTGQPNSLGQRAISGADNLYVNDTETGETSFIAELCSGEAKSGSQTGVSACWGDDRLGEHAFTNRNGSVLVFNSFAQLTPDDTNQSADVYRYDAETGSLARVSIGHNSEADQNGNGGCPACIPGATVTATESQVWNAGSANARPMTEDGRSIVFATARPLEEGDENEKVDIYEWHDGQVSLVSGGQSHTNLPSIIFGPSPFLSPSGRDLVIVTDANLASGLGDPDGLPDVYDVRMDGGFPPPQQKPAVCQGAEACHGPAGPEPTPPVLGSEVIHAPGNVIEKPKKCKKGFVRRNGKCVKHHHKRRRHKRADRKHGGGK
jgi:hypothetical protein